MKRFVLNIILFFLAGTTIMAQDRKVQNRPYTDLRPLHFGIHVGTHIQDIEFTVAPVTLVDDEGNEQYSFITCDQDRVDPGFNVGVLGEFRLSENFQLRIAPAIYFGSRHITFHSFNEYEDEEENENKSGFNHERRQDLKTAYVTTSIDLIFAAPRCNNHRAYMFAGLTPSLNLTGKSTDFFKLKGFQNFVEVGFGFDEYLPYFKCRPELKFMFGLGNALDMNHPAELRDKTMVSYAMSAKSASTKMITLSFYFE